LATIVLAHGAWSSAWAWKKVRPLMAAAGHTFYMPSYTGLGERHHLANPSNDLETHIADVLGVIEAEELKDFVLMGHSYGGMVATGVADRARDKVSKLIYLDAFVPRDGQALIDLLPDGARKDMLARLKAGDGWSIAGNPPPGDTSPEDLAWVAKHRRTQSIKCFDQPLGMQAELTVPRAYIQCMRYAAHGPFSQFAEHAKNHNGWKSYELDASHSPNVTAPDALMKVLQQVLAEG
jgi:pimeloyl-ACP methyl ester carboxylesterase